MHTNIKSPHQHKGKSIRGVFQKFNRVLQNGVLNSACVCVCVCVCVWQREKERQRDRKDTTSSLKWLGLLSKCNTWTVIIIMDHGTKVRALNREFWNAGIQGPWPPLAGWPWARPFTYVAVFYFTYFTGWLWASNQLIWLKVMLSSAVRWHYLVYFTMA